MTRRVGGCRGVRTLCSSTGSTGGHTAMPGWARCRAIWSRISGQIFKSSYYCSYKATVGISRAAQPIDGSATNFDRQNDHVGRDNDVLPVT